MPTKKPKIFVVDAKAILTLGRNSIKDHTTAVIELVKNSYDADASLVELGIESGGNLGDSIRISDNGHGMSEKDIQASWLRIGFSEKILNKKSAIFGRRKTGEKGIGRLSADRLGEVLELRSQRKNLPATGLLIDWSQFEKSGKNVGDVQLKELTDPKPIVPKARTAQTASHGTELRIHRLRQDWTSDDVRRLYAELESLLPPYQEIAKTFVLRFSNNVDTDLNGRITYGKNTKGEIEFSGDIDEAGQLTYTISYRDWENRAKYHKEHGKLAWEDLAPDSGSRALRANSKLGTIKLRLSYFVRRADLLEGTGLQLSQLRNFLDRNAGVKIYRDIVRVKPYGDPGSPEGDWLGLSERKSRDPAGAGRPTFRIAANQLVGAVFVGRDDSPNLMDSSSREGLIDNDAFKQLKSVMMKSIALIEAKYHATTSRAKGAPRSKAAEAKAAVKRLSGELTTLKSDLTHLQTQVKGELNEEARPILEQIQLVLEHVASAEREIDEIADQNTVFRGLATVGIASAIFGHETAVSITQAAGKIEIAKRVLAKNPPDVARALERINQSEEFMDRIATWGKFALSRVNKDKRQRRRSSITELATSILNELEPLMINSTIELKRSIAIDVEAKTFPMDIEAVLINFLTNSYHEVKKKNSGRIIRVRLARKNKDTVPGFEITVTDSGLGIKIPDPSVIWEPLFSTKVDGKGKSLGTGLGLAIVKSAVEEAGGSVFVNPTSPLGGALFGCWLPKGF
jgi:signal transduction histidine kinase